MEIKTCKKVWISIGAVAFVLTVVIAGVWYSVPKEQRNMIMMMAGGSESYDNYDVYDVIERNESDLESSFDTYESEDGNVNIVTVTEMVINTYLNNEILE